MATRFLAWIIVGIVWSTMAYPAAAARAPSANFERMFPSAYTDILRDEKNAYGDKHYDKAFKLFERAACAGDKESQSALGRMYLLGQGVKREDLVGYAWLKVAAQVSLLGYRTIVTKLEGAMTPPQRKIADRLGATTIDLYGIAATHMSCQGYASRGGHIIDTIMCTPEIEGNQALLRRCVVGALP